MAAFLAFVTLAAVMVAGVTIGKLIVCWVQGLGGGVSTVDVTLLDLAKKPIGPGRIPPSSAFPVYLRLSCPNGIDRLFRHRGSYVNDNLYEEIEPVEVTLGDGE